GGRRAAQDDLHLAVGPLLRLVRAPVPDRHGPAAVLALRDLALEGEVLHRVVLGVHGQVVGGRVGRQALGHRPGDQHPVTLQAQVPVEGAGVVLLDDERVAVRGRGGLVGNGLGGTAGVPFTPVLPQFVSHTGVLPATSRLHERRRPRFREDDLSQAPPREEKPDTMMRWILPAAVALAAATVSVTVSVSPAAAQAAPDPAKAVAAQPRPERGARLAETPRTRTATKPPRNHHHR